MCLGIVSLQVRSHVVFDEDVLHAERGVVVVEAERGGEGDVVVESVGFGDFGFDVERCLLWLLAEGKWYFVVEEASSLFTIDPHFGIPREFEESIVVDLHGFSGKGTLCLVHGDDDVGHVLDFFVEIFKDFHAEGAKSAPCAGAFLNDLCARIELWCSGGLHGGLWFCLRSGCGALRSGCGAEEESCDEGEEFRH